MESGGRHTLQDYLTLANPNPNPREHGAITGRDVRSREGGIHYRITKTECENMLELNEIGMNLSPDR